MTAKEYIKSKIPVIINNTLKYLRARFFCKHDWKSVDNSPQYFHWRCCKCPAEKGMGNFRYTSH